jgi:hypothetical protein
LNRLKVVYSRGEIPELSPGERVSSDEIDPNVTRRSPLSGAEYQFYLELFALG